MPKKRSTIEEGDDVILRGKATRVPDPNDQGIVYITVRIDGVDVPVTLNERWVEKAKD